MAARGLQRVLRFRGQSFLVNTRLRASDLARVETLRLGLRKRHYGPVWDRTEVLRYLILRGLETVWWVYLIECSDGTLYCGIAKDWQARIKAHNDGTARCKYTRGRRPVEMVWVMLIGDDKEARRVERKVKRLSPAKKRAFVGGGE